MKKLSFQIFVKNIWNKGVKENDEIKNKIFYRSLFDISSWEEESPYWHIFNIKEIENEIKKFLMKKLKVKKDRIRKLFVETLDKGDIIQKYLIRAELQKRKINVGNYTYSATITYLSNKLYKFLSLLLYLHSCSLM